MRRLSKTVIQFAAKLSSRCGTVQELLDIFRKYRDIVMNVPFSPESDDEKYPNACIRIQGIDSDFFFILKEELWEKAIPVCNDRLFWE